MAKQYVCHISGQGEKWELDGEAPNEYEGELDWCVKSKIPGRARHWLPKSEYRLCEPPEVWRDVTEECVVTDDKWPPNSEHGEAVARHSCVLYEPTYWVKNERLRIRKVLVQMKGRAGTSWAFIVEQKVQP